MAIQDKGSKLYKIVKQFKAYIITEELIKHNWSVSKTARTLGIHRNSLTRHIADLEIVLQRKRKHAPTQNIESKNGRIEQTSLSSAIENVGDGSLPAN